MNEIIKHIEEIDAIVEEREKNPSIAIKIARKLSYSTLDNMGVGAIVVGSIFTFISGISAMLNSDNILFVLLCFIVPIGMLTTSLAIIIKSINECTLENKKIIEILKSLKDVMDGNGECDHQIMKDIVDKKDKLPRWWWQGLKTEISNYKETIKDKEEINDILSLVGENKNIEEELGVNFKKQVMEQ